MALKQKPSHIPNFGSIARHFRDRASAIALKMVDDFAESERVLFKQKILDQNFPAFHAFPLRPTTVAAKRRARVDLRVMIATRTYINSIQVFRKLKNDGRGATFRIGFHPRKRARDYHGHITDILLSEVAMIQEHGSVGRNIPARPHWQPHFVTMQQRAVAERREIRDTIVQEIRRDIKLGRIG